MLIGVTKDMRLSRVPGRGGCPFPPKGLGAQDKTVHPVAMALGGADRSGCQGVGEGVRHREESQVPGRSVAGSLGSCFHGVQEGCRGRDENAEVSGDLGTDTEEPLVCTPKREHAVRPARRGKGV